MVRYWMSKKGVSVIRASSEKQALGDRENTWSVSMESTTENKIPSFR